MLRMATIDDLSGHVFEFLVATVVLLILEMIKST